ncbi:hypothetical protein ET445_16570 [Agromyces protaetiae]|uniref:Sortase n=1 Tax=Agromyces protaetiae TaxID=2509455 RepID=A0A4P6FJD1_9MICO|nr:hypothetical protein [Agromyces protaetiae]QAY74709.1 hypothetical protein ET445_16570 [Agromyces protaetiae]
MFRRILAAAAIAVAAVIAVPVAANAVGYTAQGPTVTEAVGGSADLTFSGFPANTPSTATAPDAVTLSVLKASTFSRPTDANGSVTYTATASQPGTYTITVTAGGVVATGTLTVLPADSEAGGDDGLSATGYDAPVLAIWIAGGALLLGAAIVVVVTSVRRSRNRG